MFSMGFLGTALTDYVGVGNVRRYRARFAKQTWPDEELRTKIVVTGKRTEGADHLIDLDVRLQNAEGEEKVVGEATAVVPSQGLTGLPPALVGAQKKLNLGRPEETSLNRSPLAPASSSGVHIESR